MKEWFEGAVSELVKEEGLKVAKLDKNCCVA